MTPISNIDQAFNNLTPIDCDFSTCELGVFDRSRRFMGHPQYNDGIRTQAMLDLVCGSNFGPVPVEDCAGVITDQTLGWGQTTIVGTVYTKPCPDTTFDSELVCLTDDGGATRALGTVTFDMSTNPPTATYILNGIDVTATHQIIQCAENQQDIEKTETCREVTANGTGYVIGDIIQHIRWWDLSVPASPTVVSEVFINTTQNTILVGNAVLSDSVLCLNPANMQIIGSNDQYDEDIDQQLRGVANTSMPVAVMNFEDIGVYDAADPPVRIQWTINLQGTPLVESNLDIVYDTPTANDNFDLSAAALADGTYEMNISVITESGEIVGLRNAVQMTVSGGEWQTEQNTTLQSKEYTVHRCVEFLRCYQLDNKQIFDDVTSTGAVYNVLGEVTHGECCCEQFPVKFQRPFSGTGDVPAGYKSVSIVVTDGDIEFPQMPGVRLAARPALVGATFPPVLEISATESDKYNIMGDGIIITPHSSTPTATHFWVATPNVENN